MVNIEEIYRKLTNVDISQQQILWDERGKGYYGEFLVFRELYPYLPGNCKILMNINIPAMYGKTTEIDLLLIHETGLYVFEMKHYKGTIYGKPHEAKWTQYFRTVANQSFRSPVEQNKYHISNLRKIVHDIPIHSFIVFTSDECDLKVECSEPDITICTLASLRFKLNPLTLRSAVINMEQIDHLFRTLLPYSPTSQHAVNVDGNEMLFHDYVSALSANYMDKAQQLEVNCQAQVAKAQEACQKKIKETAADCQVQKIRARAAVRTSIIVAILIALASIVITVLICTQYKQYSTEQIVAAQQELATFAQKFEHVAPYNNGNITLEEGFITASDVKLSKSVDAKNTVNLHFTLNWNGEYYGANISRNTKIIVILKDGSVKEYDLLESSFPYSSSDLRLGKGNVWYSAYTSQAFPVHELSGIEIDDISYIKLSGLDIWVTEDGSYTPVLIGTGYEVRIY